MFRSIVSLGCKDQLDVLREAGLSSEHARAIISSGYEIIDICDALGGPSLAVLDHAYGSELPYSLFPIELLKDWLRVDPETMRFRGDLAPIAKSTEECQQRIDEFLSHLNPDLRPRLRVAFRGQTTEYPLVRQIRNLSAIDLHRTECDHEINLVPSYYRKHAKRFTLPDGIALFIWKELFDHEPQELDESQLEERPSLMGSAYPVAARIGFQVAQHYGLATCGLDITDDLDIAVWFATHQLDPATRQYSPVEWRADRPFLAWPVVYCFLWEPDEYERITSYRDLRVQPERVLRQKCSVMWYGPEEQNGAATRLLFRFFLHPGFRRRCPAFFRELFPSPDEDEFYRRLVQFKHEHVSVWVELEDIVEYEYG